MKNFTNVKDAHHLQYGPCRVNLLPNLMHFGNFFLPNLHCCSQDFKKSLLNANGTVLFKFFHACFNALSLLVVKTIFRQRVKWLESQDCDRHGLDSKPTCAILLCP